MQRREIYDTETGFQYLRARYYNPETGRFTTRDTWGGNQSNPITLNKYLYGNGNPVMMVDPSGEFSLSNIMASQVVQSVLRNIAIAGVGMISMGTFALVGIPRDGSAFNEPDAILMGTTLPSYGSNISGFGGVDFLLSNKHPGKIWMYGYVGINFNFSLSNNKTTLKFIASVYSGLVFNVKNDDKRYDYKAYEGKFFTLSGKLLKLLRPKLLKFIPLNAAVFSGGSPDSSYGFSLNPDFSEGLGGVSGAWSYFLYLTTLHYNTKTPQETIQDKLKTIKFNSLWYFKD